MYQIKKNGEKFKVVYVGKFSGEITGLLVVLVGFVCSKTGLPFTDFAHAAYTQKPLSLADPPDSA